jgi:hypothetical protein
MVTKNKSKNTAGASISESSARSSQEANAEDGVANTKIIEPIPEYLAAASEKVIRGENNTWIVLGRDRPGTRRSGKGGRGETHCGSIDLVVGRMGYKAATVNSSGKKLYVDPDYINDASRVIISQRTDIDKNMNLSKGKIGNSENRAAIALKSDSIRIAARQGIKLVTMVDETTSTGSPVAGDFNRGIDLIGGNSQAKKGEKGAMQPMVLGDNLVTYLMKLNKELSSLAGNLAGYIKHQMDINKAFLHHIHRTVFPVFPTSPQENTPGKTLKGMMNQISRTAPALVANKQRLITLTKNNLKNTGKTYILSDWHHLN